MSRRAISAALVTGALGLWAGVALVALQRADLRYRAGVEAAAIPRLSTADGRGLIATADEVAQRDLARFIGDAGAAAGVRLSLTTIAGGIDGVIAARIVAQGSEAGLLRFSAAVEQGSVPVRWIRWSILPDGDGRLRLSADAAAPWRARGAAPTGTGPAVILAAAQPSPIPGRTLFALSPITAETSAPESAPRLIGIVGRLPDDGVALLRLGDGSTRGLRQGEAAEGWTVAAIASDRVRLTQAGRDHVQILPPTGDAAQ